MSKLRKIFAVSFRAKVLVPVIAVMILLLATTAWVLNRRITQQFETDAIRTLATTDARFRELQKNRTKNLLLRFRDLRNEPRFRAAFQTGDFPTVRRQLEDLLDAADHDVDIVHFTMEADGSTASTKRDPLISIADFETGSAAVVARALQADEKVDTIHVGERLYDVVSIPVFDTNDRVIGALTLGSEIGNDVASELSNFTHSQVVLLAGGRVIVSTASTPASIARFPALFDELAEELAGRNTSSRVKREVIGGEHYFCSGGRFASLSADETIGYLLLHSYEQPLRALHTTQQMLLAVNGLAILLGSAVICFLVGKATRPLRELRDSAEAVGRGDFSRRVKVRYDDECGELARVFNQMTENLKHSREQLELTVETLKTTQAQLIQSEKLSGIGEFIAGVAHELNNPLTSVMGFSELLRQGGADPRHKRYLDMIHKSALRCQKIVQALLSFARRRAPERTPACVNSLIEASIEILQYQLRTSNIEVIPELDSRLPQTLVDPHQIQQVLVNLLNNARQAIETHQPKGWIRLTTRAQDGNVQIIIQDSGPGIPEENLSRIFDPFFTTKDVGQGTGLGLSLCYGIVKEHGGTIIPRSRPGEGATFVIELPATGEAIDTTEEHSATDGVPIDATEGAGKRVLVIDDEEPILHMVREALTPNGYEVDVAQDGETGLRKSSRRRYDVMLCDWKMPGLNGRQVYERLQASNPALCERIIFVTGDIVNDHTRRFLEQQKKICLPKPFTIAEFRDAIRKVLKTA